jgi:hypothetical protein
VSESIKHYSNLLFDRKLGMIRIIEEDGVVLESSDKCIKCKWTDSEILAEMVCSASLKRCEDVVKV